MPTNPGDSSDEAPAEPPQSRSDFSLTSEGGLTTGGEADTELDLSSALGASVELSPQVLRLYIPNKDRNGRRIWRQRKWTHEAAELLTAIGGGVTIMPPVKGGWHDEVNRKIVWENPVIVYTYVKPNLFQFRLPALREFLHRLGRETNQGEIAFEFDGDFYRIYQYDEA